jgi:lipopolysaccharide export system protein LptA
VLRPALAALLLALGLAAAAAQTKPPAPGGKAQREQPIEINADTLEVQQDKQVAIFTGNVDAVQGELRLKADQLKVWYRQGEKGEKGEKAAAAGAATPAGAIVRIDAIGRVFVSSPTQTAQGDVGVYDVDSRVITLTGRVVVTQEQNVVRGDRLVMNLDSGQAKMDGQGRVHGLFTPSKQGGKP